MNNKKIGNTKKESKVCQLQKQQVSFDFWFVKFNPLMCKVPK